MLNEIQEFQVRVFKALAHPTRLELIRVLGEEGAKCVCELVQRSRFDQSTISKHLSILKAAGIVTSTKEGLNVIYRLNMECVYSFMKCIEQVALTRDAHRCFTCTLGRPSDAGAPDPVDSM
ncbi:MAG: helix-turn-helix transcriptional regulator [Firmicutes bacterium]|nr:helix-turn-helix transcriptional regulator [Candidatus Fermentithermobacillaceae bacterium]